MSTFAQMTRHRAMILALLTATFALYAATIDNPLVFDDKAQLVDGYIYGKFSEIWLRLRWLSYGTFNLTRALFGEAWIYDRLLNIGLHAATVVMLFQFLRRLFQLALGVDGDDTERKYDRMAFAGAGLFAIYPVAVYATAYLIQRSIIMAALFGLLALFFLLEAISKKEKRYLIVALLAYLAAVSSKEHAALLLLPAVPLILVLDKSSEQKRKRLLQFGIVTVAILALFAWANIGLLARPMDQASAELSSRFMQSHPGVTTKDIYLLSMVNEAALYFKYWLSWLVPSSNWYSIDVRPAFPASVLAWPYVVGVLAFLAYLALSVWLLSKGRELGLLGWALFFPWLMYWTELATVWIQDPFVVYRGYLWILGVPAAIPAIYMLLGKRVSVILLIIVSASALATTAAKLATFEDEISLWSDAIKSNEKGAEVYGLERAYNERALAYLIRKDYHQALKDYNEAIDINPGSPDLYVNRAAVYQLTGRLTEAQHDLDVALSLDVNNQRVYANRAAFYHSQGNIARAYEEYDVIIKKNLGKAGVTADDLLAHGKLALALGKHDEAMQDMNHALKRNSACVDCYVYRAALHVYKNNKQAALDDFTSALNLDGFNVEARLNRAVVNIGLGNQAAAMQDVDVVIGQQPQNTRAHLIRAQILVQQGKLDTALQEYQTVLTIDPEEPMARLNRGELYMHMGNSRVARDEFAVACKKGLSVACQKLAQLK